MLMLNQRVRFRDELCQVVSVTPGNGGTTYKLKHLASEQVMDADFVISDLEVVEPAVAAEEERALVDARNKALAQEFGETPTDPADVRDRKLEAIRSRAKPPVRPETVIDGRPKIPWAPSAGEDVSTSRIAGEEENQTDYTSPDGSVDEDTPETLK